MSLEFDSTRIDILKNAVLALPDVRKEKVEALRNTISSAKYEVTNVQIADALLRDDLLQLAL